MTWNPPDDALVRRLRIAVGEAANRLRGADRATAITVLAGLSPDCWFHPAASAWIRPLLNDIRVAADLDEASFVGALCDAAVPDEAILAQGFGTVAIPEPVNRWLNDAGVTTSVIDRHPHLILGRCPFPVDYVTITAPTEVAATLASRASGTWPAWTGAPADRYLAWLANFHQRIDDRCRHDHRAMLLCPVSGLSWVLFTLSDPTMSLVHGLVLFATGSRPLTFDGSLTTRDSTAHLLITNGRLVLEVDWLADLLSLMGVSADRMPYLDLAAWERRLLEGRGLATVDPADPHVWVIDHAGARSWVSAILRKTSTV
jgi:hypothetical protein